MIISKETFKDEAFDFSHNGYDYVIDVEAEAEHFHEDGRMYMSNGDPGYPDDDEFEIRSVRLNSVRYIDGEGETDVWVEVTDEGTLNEIKKAVTDWLYDNSEVFE